MPFLANLTGWIFTEMGRQPWIVAPNPTGDADVRLTTATAVSPYVDVAVGRALADRLHRCLYGALAVVWFGLDEALRHRRCPERRAERSPPTRTKPLAFAY